MFIQFGTQLLKSTHHYSSI